MAISDFTFQGLMRFLQPNRKRLEGFITIGGAGAVSAQGQGLYSGTVSWAKNAATGQYDATIHRSYKRVMGFGANVSMPTAGTAPTLADGNQAFIQGITAAMMVGGANPTALPTTGVCIQTTRTDTQAKANPTSGVTIHWWIDVSDS